MTNTNLEPHLFRRSFLPAMFAALLLLSGLFHSSAMASDEDTRLLRFPTIHENQIVFSYAGNLYTVSVHGGNARRLTSHEGYEIFPRYSPDGTRIAFTGQYDGNTEVYVIPSGGGEPQRKTYTPTLDRDDVADRMGPNNIVMDWTPDGEQVLFRSRKREFNSFKGHLYLTDPDGDLAQQLPLPRGGFASYSPDGSKLAYNRVFREFRTWKRYRGGQADDIWVYDFDTKETIQVTDSEGQDIIPMWHGDMIYFISDREESGRMNLYVHDLESDETRKLTDFTEFDIKFPSIGKRHIVFENGGYIYRFNLSTEEKNRVPIRVKDDRITGRGGLVDASEFIHSYDVAPDGSRVLFGARGDIFTVPARSGITRNLTQSSGVHDRNPVWSPDGEYVAFISDKTGEDEIYVKPQDGSGEKQQITTDADTYKYRMVWSPDSRKLLWADKKLRLNMVDVETGEVTVVREAEAWEFSQYTWSPDSRWIAYTLPEVRTMSRVWLYSVEDDEHYEVTKGWYSAGNPEFSRDGKYLYFVSNRDFNPIYSQTEWNHAYADMQRIYFVTLQADESSPFKPENDEVSLNNNEEEDDNGFDPSESIPVDTEGIGNRIVDLPVQPSSYGNLQSVGNRIYYQRNGMRDQQTMLLFYDLEAKEEQTVGAFNGYRITADGKKMLLVQGDDYAVVDLPSQEAELDPKVDLSDVKVRLDRTEEWVQIFNESWRQMRDFLYAPNLHGVDWEAIRETYRPLVDHVAHRNDLTYVIGEMIGELNVGHAYVGDGDRREADRTPMGRLGAELDRDDETGFYRIDRILRGENWEDSRRSPLTEVGVDISEGQYIVRVDGNSTAEMTNIYKSLIDKAEKPVILSINDEPGLSGARDVVIKPVSDELDLYYYNWVQENIRKVNEASDGRVGYIHIPDMGPGGLNEFIKHFYPQLKKEALIIDVRGNGGGNVSPMIIERLRRELAMVDKPRNAVRRPDPSAMMLGPMVTLIDQFSASDGDLFPYRFRKHELGKLIGTRTWGGVVGIRQTLPFVDGGYLNRPEFASYDTDGEEWIIEGVGVEPDMYVDNDPAKEYGGIDEQLNAGVEHLLELLEEHDFSLPDPPDYPIKR
ncbi:S41 family peptidase [Natronogracilivirga saccharolytica]|uniref:Tricorn protease homolog n=1 Tax=Natronogracilivirga saccharolytica TaxID=2812953 RepID=A0A8J7RIJ1_9BACT|nr:S41 family peptidase [Natronogracilivirga saccharolytica]MBP3191265.1 PD40 domain-containing protein [Natronogracilivirga saccharolytica]